MDNAMIPFLLLVLLLLLVGVLALLVLLIIRARQSGLLAPASGVKQPNAENADNDSDIDFQTAFFRVFDEHPSPQIIHRDFVIERVNPAFVTELGYAPEDVIGRPVIYLLDEQPSGFLIDQVETQGQKIFEDHELPPERIVRVRMKGDIYAPFATQSNRVSLDGRTICLTIHRLTDQEEVAEALTAASLGFSSAPTNLVSKIVTSLVAREQSARLVSEHFSSPLESWGRSR